MIILQGTFLSVSLMFLPHFDNFCDLFTEQMHSNMESRCFMWKGNKIFFNDIICTSVL